MSACLPRCPLTCRLSGSPLLRKRHSVRTVRRCHSPKMSIRSVTSVRTVSTNLSAKSFRSRAARRDLHGLDTGISQGCVKRRGKLPGPVPYQEPEVRSAIPQIHQQVADLLHGPRTVRIRGDPEDVHAAAARQLADLPDPRAHLGPRRRRQGQRPQQQTPQVTPASGGAQSRDSHMYYSVPMPSGSAANLAAGVRRDQHPASRIAWVPQQGVPSGRWKAGLTCGDASAPGDGACH
jgi:hypothetical protein